MVLARHGPALDLPLRPAGFLPVMRVPTKRKNLLLRCRCGCFCFLPLPFLLSFRSEAEESAFAAAFVFAVAFLVVIPQRSGGICFPSSFHTLTKSQS
jgi:hypothetical protein